MGSLEDSLLWKLLHASAWQWGLLLVVLVAMIGGIMRIRTWLHDHEDPAELDQSMLSKMTDLKQQGELSPEEFQSIKSQLVARLKSAEIRPNSAGDTGQSLQADSQPE